MKVWVEGAELLTTQLYFRDDPFNALDDYIESSLIMDYAVDGSGDWAATFELVVPQQ